jgi:hypothetical protein
MMAAPNAAILSVLLLRIPLPLIFSFLHAIDPSLQLMKTIAALTDFSPKIHGSFQLHHPQSSPFTIIVAAAIHTTTLLIDPIFVPLRQ